jgi:hypothetical protein
MLDVFLRVIVIWCSDENFDSPNAIETPKFPPPIMCTFMLVVVFLSTTLSKGKKANMESVSFYYIFLILL